MAVNHIHWLAQEGTRDKKKPKIKTNSLAVLEVLSTPWCEVLQLHSMAMHIKPYKCIFLFANYASFQMCHKQASNYSSWTFSISDYICAVPGYEVGKLPFHLVQHWKTHLFPTLHILGIKGRENNSSQNSICSTLAIKRTALKSDHVT